jgi:hypothetical protein
VTVFLNSPFQSSGVYLSTPANTLFGKFIGLTTVSRPFVPMAVVDRIGLPAQRRVLP